MFKDNYSKECDFAILLPYINSSVEKSRARILNKNVSLSLYPLTKNYLVNHYLNTNYSNLKKSFSNVNCAADVYSYFIQSYGYRIGTGSDATASSAQSSGLNPFFGVNADLGFNFGSIGSYLWLILIGAGLLYWNKK